eukprot:CAMPEP_0196664078 /NCGR_PEP_ID=MMETSP1086-20130531/55518_1 /TAXON_ID=77921 /ORGANISM="Cyanoptyche  gloeocystis , Strain SAG4.97" /LENGTH=165 /DNA_ID=CAMNT_0042000199 /DNA_START=168 /DNA_END=666 /DNA_ORIENTATION=-
MLRVVLTTATAAAAPGKKSGGYANRDESSGAALTKASMHQRHSSLHSTGMHVHSKHMTAGCTCTRAAALQRKSRYPAGTMSLSTTTQCGGRQTKIAPREGGRGCVTIWRGSENSALSSQLCGGDVCAEHLLRYGGEHRVESKRHTRRPQCPENVLLVVKASGNQE